MKKFSSALILLITVIALSVSAQTPTASPATESPSSPAQAQPQNVNPNVAASPETSASPSSNLENAAASGTARPLPVERNRPVRVPRFSSAPVIDGRLDDVVWRSAAMFADFVQTQPGDNVAPSRRTEAFLGYDSRNLYVAFRAFDEPANIRSTVAQRDNVFEDDNVRIVLDTFNDQRRAYILIFNALGIQADGILTEGRGEDYSVDIVMESKGEINQEGYVVEVAIPFKSLRYEAGGDRQWGLHLARRIKRFNNELDSWMPLSRDRSDFLGQAGRITGLDGIDTERQLEIIPSLTLSQTGTRVRTLPFSFLDLNPGAIDPGRFRNDGLDFDPGLTVKFSLTPAITLDFALNPDFAQVEADETVVTANQRFPIFFEEKRPFFLERIDIFQTRMNVVNTRAIVDPDVAVKLTGRRGRNTFGLLLASDNAPGNFSEDERNALNECVARREIDPTINCGSIERLLDRNALIGVLRLRRDVGRDSNVGMFATSYNFIERRNQLGGFDGRFRLDPQTIAEFQVVGTHSRRFFYDPDLNRRTYRTGNGFGYSYALDRSGRNFGFVFNGVGRTRDYRADVGFTPRVNTNQHRAFFRYSTEPQANRTIVSRRLSNQAFVSHDWDGRLQNWQYGPQFMVQFQRQTFVGAGGEIGYERLFEEEFGPRRSATQTGAFFGADPERSAYYRTLYGFIESNFNRQYSGELVIIHVWNAFDFDFGAGPRFPRVSPAALINPNAPRDPGTGNQFRIEAEFRYQPTAALSISLDYTKSRLTRDDTGLVAFNDNIYSLRSVYQFTRNSFARARLDYSTLDARMRAQVLFGYTPNPGTALYIGYNDDLNRNGFNPFTGQLEPGFRRNGRTFFIKMSYLFQRSI
jgi:hypothetical protein